MTTKPMIVQTRPAMASQVSGRSCHSGRVPASFFCSLILTPHAHRKKAAVGAITRTMTRAMIRSMALVPFLLLDRARLARLMSARDARGPEEHESLHFGHALTAVRQHEVQILQHTGRRPPDVAIAVRHGVETPLAALPDAAVDAMVLDIEEVRQRHLEDVGDLARVCMDGESWRHDAHHWADLVAG